MADPDINSGSQDQQVTQANRPATAVSTKIGSTLSVRPVSSKSVREDAVIGSRPNTAGSLCDKPDDIKRQSTIMSRSTSELGDGVNSRPTSAISQRPSSSLSRNAWTEEDIDDKQDTLSNISVPVLGEQVELDTVPEKEPAKASSAFKSFIKTIWITRDTEDTAKNPQLYIKTTLRELIIYIIFLISLCVLTFGMTSGNAYYYSKVMSELFLDTTYSDTKNTFRMSTTTEDFFRFTEEVLMDGLYTDSEVWYNGKNISTKNQGYILHENKLLGVARLRQLKVRHDSCVVHEDFKQEIQQCFAAYSDAALETGELFKLPDTSNYSTAYTYQSSDALDGSSHSGKFASYGGGGYVQKLNVTRAESLEIIAELKKNLWINRGTRVVFIDFSVYNANINLFCVVRLTMEFPPTGGVVPQWHFRTIKLLRYVDAADFVVLAFEALFILFIIYYSVEEAIEIEKNRLKYFKSFWNILDILVIVTSYICIAYNIYRTISVRDKLDTLLDQPEEYPDFEFLSYWQIQFNNAIAIMVFMAWVKVFKYINFNKTMSQLSSTLSECAIDLAGFAIMFLIIFIAFAQLGYLIFGTQVKDFSSFSSSIFTLFRIVLGDFNFQDLEKANRVLGPIYFIMYVFFVFFVLLNMFLAIINDTYTEVKADIASGNQFSMADYFKQSYKNMIQRLNQRKEKISDIQNAIATADEDNDRIVNFDEWKKDLIKRGYCEEEIEVVFAQYDVDGNRVLDEDEQKKMLADLESQKVQLSKNVENLKKAEEKETKAETPVKGCPLTEGVPLSKFNILTERVNGMETSIGSIVSKIDAVLVKLEAMERAKSKRRETMNKILENLNNDDGETDEERREHMERLVREELERWDTESFICLSPSASRAASRAGIV